MVANRLPKRNGCGRISGLFVEALILRAKMDIRAPRANRGAGFKSQGCYRPDAVSVVGSISVSSWLR